MIEKAGYAAFAESLFRQMFFKPSREADAIVARAVRQSRGVRPDAVAQHGALGCRGDGRGARRGARAAARHPEHHARCAAAPLASEGRADDALPRLDKGSVPGARIAVVPDTGHFTQIEAADEVNRLIADFIKR